MAGIIEELTKELIKEIYGLDSITINDCFLVPFYQLEDKLKKLKKIEQIVNEQVIMPEGAYPKLKQIKQVLEER